MRFLCYSLVWALCLCVRLSVVAQDCDLALHLDGEASQFNVSGVASTGVLGDLSLTPLYPEQRVGMTGTLFFQSSGGCPATNRQLQRVLASGNFTVAASEDLRLYPQNATLDAASVATIDFLGMRFAYRWKEIRRGEESNVILSDTTLRVLDGVAQYSVSSSLGLDVEPGQASLEDNVSRQRQSAVLSLDDSRIRLEVQDAAFAFSETVETGVDLIPSLDVTLNLTGRLVAEAFLECSDVACGENGRCVALESGESVCECACGWTGENCDVPSGFCNQYGEVVSTVQLAQPETSSSPPPRRQNLVQECESLFSEQQCPDARSRYDFAGQRCFCVEGWKGQDCDICEAGGACPDFFEEGAACLTDGFYDSRSGEKIYECDLRSTGLNAFVGNFIKFVCSTTGPNFHDQDFQEAVQRNPDQFPDEGHTPFCTVDFNFQQTTPVNCTAWGCRYRPGSARVECSTMLCDCEDCEAIESVVNSISNVVLECSDPDECVVEFGGLSIAVEAPCEIGECLLPSNTEFMETLKDDDGFKMNWDIFIISMPLTFLGLLLLLFGVPTFLLGLRIAKSAKGAPPAAVVKPEGQTGAEITFQDVHCLVPSTFVSWPFARKRGRDWKTAEESGKLVENLAAFDFNAGNPIVTPRRLKSVLHGVTGTVQRGQLLAVMGPSGGGKTTFLSIICSISADQNTKRRVDGKIHINGREAGRWARRLVAFVPQDDKLLSTLTVQESLMYSAILRMTECTMSEIKQKVRHTLKELNLTHVASSQVGGVRNRRGISGGERRRVTIGMELVIDPDLVILDEPTSGLDSYTALNLMHTLKSISRGGRTVILSVHQPTPAMLEMLDQVLLLSQGHQVYLGPPQEASAFFARHGFQREEDHIGEFMLKVVSSPDTLKPLLESVYAERRSTAGGDRQQRSESTPTRGPLVLRRQSVLTSIFVLLWRGFLDIVRNPALLLAHAAVAIVIGSFCGGVFYDASLDIEGAQNRLGAAFFVLAFLGFWSLTTIDLLHAERDIVQRETSSGYYNAYIYLVSKIVLDAVLLRVLPAVLITLPLYYMMHLQRTWEKFTIFLLTVSTFNMAVGLISMAITLTAPTPGTASLLINTILLVGLLFTGHLVNIPSIPKVLRWLHHLSPFHYGFQVLAVNELLGLRLNFRVEGYADVNGIGGDVFLRTIGIEDHDITQDLEVFLIYYCTAFALTFKAMLFARHFDSLLARLAAFVT